MAAAAPTTTATIAALKDQWSARQDADNPRPDFWTLSQDTTVTAPSLAGLDSSFATEWAAADQAEQRKEAAKLLAARKSRPQDKAPAPIVAPNGGTLSDYLANGGSLDALMAAEPEDQDGPEEPEPTPTTAFLPGRRPPEEDPPPTLTIDEIREELADEPPARWMNLDDPDDYDELADRLYNTLSSRLRFDVLVERERSGTLLDFS
ncbi:hypothetical protein ACFPM7_21325 [Actinokineospora guangxiensis]|uniref:Uncharacterized protein n=1 Tax=Actinokineospora guangxiensis TaxID=1490288 RepID=A0ABW0ES30_9PSEU